MRSRYLILVILVLLAVGVLYFMVQQNAAEKSVGDEFRSVALAMQNRISGLGDLPPAVRWSDVDPPVPLYSWRLEISDFLEGFGYFGRDHSSWDSEINSAMHGMPTSLALTFLQNDNPQNFAKIYAITGKDTAFGTATSDSVSWSPEKLPPDTIIAIEVANSNKHWMEPGDFEIDTIRDEILTADGKFLSGKVSGRFHVIFADFQVWALSTKTPFEKLELFLTKSGASSHDRDELLKLNCVAEFNGE